MTTKKKTVKKQPSVTITYEQADHVEAAINDHLVKWAYDHGELSPHDNSRFLAILSTIVSASLAKEIMNRTNLAGESLMVLQADICRTSVEEAADSFKRLDEWLKKAIKVSPGPRGRKHVWS